VRRSAPRNVGTSATRTPIRSGTDTGGPTSAAKRLLEALDRADADAAAAIVSADAQGIDEVSRRWVRGSGALIANVHELVDAVADMRSEMRDVHEEQWDDSATVTFWLEQDYTFDGRREHVSAPTTYVFRREHGDWKLVLGHSVPIPPSP
jgi:ketosteroid isomerase-like protein